MIFNIFPDDSIKKSYEESSISTNEDHNFSLDISSRSGSYNTTESIVRAISILTLKAHKIITGNPVLNKMIVIWYSDDSIDYLKFLIALKTFIDFKVFEVNCSSVIIVDKVKIKNTQCKTVAPMYLNFYKSKEKEISLQRKQILNTKLNNFNLKWDLFKLNDNHEYEGISFEKINTIINSLESRIHDDELIAFLKYDLDMNIAEETLRNQIITYKNE